MTNRPTINDLPLFPTAVVGSLPRPVWVLDLLERFSSAYVATRREQDLQTDWERQAQAHYHQNPISFDELNRGLDCAVEYAIGLQEAAGIDIITDGEWRRRSFTEVVCERVRGFESNLISGWTSVVTSPLERIGSIVADEARFLLRRTDKPIAAVAEQVPGFPICHWQVLLCLRSRVREIALLTG